MAENIDVNVNVNATAAQRNLNNLNTQLKGTTDAFGKLRSALGAIAFGSLITSTLRYADSIQDLSDSTGIATASILGFNQAVQQNGGDAESANSAILKLVQSIGEAAQGSAKTQQAFEDVGVSLQDLRTLSEEEILQKTVQGLANIDDYGKRAVVQTELLGKSLKGVNITGVASNLNAATAESVKYAAAIKSAAETQQALETSLNNLKIALLDVLKPIADVLKDLTASIETIKGVIKVLLILGAAVASMTLLGKAASSLATAFRTLAGAAEAIQAGTFSLGIRLQNLGKIGQVLGDIITWIGTKFSNLITKSPKLAAAIEYLAASFTPLIGAITATVTGFGLFESAAEKSQRIVEEMNKASADAHAESNRRAEQEQQNIRNVIDALAKQAQEIRNITTAYKDNNDEFIRTIQLEATYMNMSKDAVEVAKAQEDIYNRAIETIAELQKKKASLSEEESGLIPVIDQQIRIIEQSIAKDQERATLAVQNIQAIRNAQEQLNKTLELQKVDLDYSQEIQAITQQIALIGQYGDELERNQMLLQITGELQTKLVDYQKQLIDLEKQRKSLTTEQFNAELTHINTLIEKAYEYAGARVEAEQQVLDAQKAVQENALLGAQEAMSRIADQFKPYQMAQDAILQTWNNIGSAVDTFVQTGKFKFSDFAKSVLRDLAAMIIKAQILFAIKKTLGFFGLSLPGLAEGGPAVAGKPYIVGEKGPELFVPKQSGTVVPNDQLGANAKGTGMVNAPVTNNYITNNINALDAKSVAQLFAENRKTLLGVTETARREMAYGM